MAVIGVAAILLLATQSASASDIPACCPDDSTGVTDVQNVQKFSLVEGATRITAAMAGFETGTLAGFDPNNSASWKGQAQRNNNPGNLRGINGAMQQFATPGQGFSAMVRDIQAKIQGKTVTGLNSNSSIFDLINVWAPVGPENSQSSVDNYVEFVSGQIGAALGTATVVQPDGDTVSIENAPFNSYIEV